MIKTNQQVLFLGCEFIVIDVDKKHQKVTIKNKSVLRQPDRTEPLAKIYPIDNSFTVGGYRGKR